jgi:hypothetical protein
MDKDIYKVMGDIQAFVNDVKKRQIENEKVMKDLKTILQAMDKKIDAIRSAFTRR